MTTLSLQTPKGVLLIARSVNILAAAHVGAFAIIRGFVGEPFVRGGIVVLAAAWLLCAISIAPERRWAWWGALAVSTTLCFATLPLAAWIFFWLALEGAVYFAVSIGLLLPASLYFLLATRPPS